MIAKAGLGVIGLGAISVGGVALTNPRWLGMGDPMPAFHYLSDDKEFSDSSKGYSEGKFGKTYGRYLVGVTNKNGESKNNKDWWDWAYRRLGKKETRPEKFKSVTQGYGDNGNTFLNQVCKEAYGKSDNEFWTSSENNGNDKFKKSDVWKYCSPGEIVKVNVNDYGNNKIGKDSANSSILVSTKSNDWFWEQRNKDFWETSGDWSGSKAESDSSKSLFRKHYDEKKSSNDGRKTIKDLCEDAYKSDKPNGNENKNNDDAKKFCSLEKTA